MIDTQHGVIDEEFQFLITPIFFLFFPDTRGEVGAGDEPPSDDVGEREPLGGDETG